MSGSKRKLSASHVKQQQRSVSRPSYVACPACQMQVSSRLINLHLDMICPALSSTCTSIGPSSVPCISDGAISNVDTIVSNPGPSSSEAHNFQILQNRRTCVAPESMIDVSNASRSAEETLLQNEGFEEKLTCGCSTPLIEAVKNAAQLIEHRHLCTDTEGFSLTPSSRNLETDLPGSEIPLQDDTSKNGPGYCLAADIAEKIKKDSEKSKKDSFLKYFSDMPASQAPKGHYVLEGFITVEEEQHILHSLDIDLVNPWKLINFNGLYRGKAYGQLVDLRKRMIFPAVYEMPKFLTRIIQRMERVVPTLDKFVPNETNAIDYTKDEGHYLKAHVDDRQILTGDSRWNFTHSIKNKDLLDSRRVSLTFRKSDIT
ncbi:hypothetical protein O6H91_20G022800 [Diphasiastrum complanatum]|uniref:Uncharacterized protein n=1 Tax=Diphasiastrum complanatum TaxID=34168 RepID=A0ACC2ANI3_DIPCM|nr:hypothetical protein O6H91_20G022800 [Diphasiastrum complanatum]